MGLIKGIFGGLFAFLGSLFGVVGKLLGLGKSKDEYFLDLGTTDAGAPAAPAPAAPAPAPVTAAPTPAPVAVAPKPQATSTFAPTYLIAPSTNNSRRRPGPSLSGFKEMARQVKPMA